MTYEELTNIIERNNIPKNVKLKSDSGWECCETDMDGIYYDDMSNVLIFKQDINHLDKDYFNCLICVGGLPNIGYILFHVTEINNVNDCVNVLWFEDVRHKKEAEDVKD